MVSILEVDIGFWFSFLPEEKLYTTRGNVEVCQRKSAKN